MSDIWVINQPQELYHFGKKGMKWGVINSEKGKSNTTNKQTTTNKTPKKEDDSEKKGLTPNQKKAIVIGASVVVAGLAIYGGYKLHQSGKLGKLSAIGKKKLEDSFDEKTGFRKIPNWNPKSSIDAKHALSVNGSNPGAWNVLDAGRQNNCGNTAINNELRLRGLDTIARPNSKGMRLEAMGEFFTGLDDKSFLSMKPDDGLTSAKIASANPSHVLERGKTISSRISKDLINHYPEGSRGTLFVPMQDNNHFTSWFINKGAVHFEDAQHPEIDHNKLFGMVNTKNYAGKLYDGVKSVRLDNLEVNNDTIRKAVTSRIFDAKDKASDIYDSGIIQGAGFIFKD